MSLHTFSMQPFKVLPIHSAIQAHRFINRNFSFHYMNYHAKNTKIVATISDLRCDVDFIKSLHEHGMNVVRMNTAHMTIEGATQLIENVRSVSNVIPIMLDTKGPEIRTSIVEGIEITSGDIIYFVNGKGSGDRIGTNHDKFVEETPIGAQILINDGQISFIAESKDEKGLKCIAENTAKVSNKKSINVPDVHFTLKSLTDKDKMFLDLAVKMDLEFIAHSFVRNKEDLDEVKAYCVAQGKEIDIIAKIENQEGVDNLDEILDHCYAIMVARGDLGVEVPPAQLPLIQKKMIRQCLDKAKPVIVATHMLESMIENPRATRAEVSDIANAILDGASAVMLSGETAYGEYPVAAVRTMSEIALQLHNRPRSGISFGNAVTKDKLLVMAKAAGDIALEVGAKAIIVPTISGRTARFLSALRSRIPIYALCYDVQLARKLWLSHGVFAQKFDICKTVDELGYKSVQQVYDSNGFSEDDHVVVISGDPIDKKTDAVFVKVTTFKEALAKEE
jgi:pyruvate kinase